MKTSRLKLSNQHDRTAGFTLLELLASIAIMGLVASFISYAVGSMITSNQSLAKEQNRRVEASRALDLIANDVRISKLESTRTPLGTGTVLDMDRVSETCTDTAKNRIVYSIRASGTGEIGPNVIYRYGLISASDGKINCANPLPTWPGSPISDAIDDPTITPITDPPTKPVTCNDPAVPRIAAGFYSCASDNQVSISLFSKLSNTKTYGINRIVNSGFIPATATSTNDCAVPSLASVAAASGLIGAADLLHNGINLEGGTTVLTQNPLPGSKLPCGKGLVTYTY